MPKEKDITTKCEARLEHMVGVEGSLIHLYHENTRLGLFDLSGFHWMQPQPRGYSIEASYKAHDGISWFKVTKEGLWG